MELLVEIPHPGSHEEPALVSFLLRGGDTRPGEFNRKAVPLVHRGPSPKDEPGSLLIAVGEEATLAFPLTAPPDDFGVAPVGRFRGTERRGAGGEKGSERFQQFLGIVPERFPCRHVVGIGAISADPFPVFDFKQVPNGTASRFQPGYEGTGNSRFQQDLRGNLRSTTATPRVAVRFRV